MTSSADKTNATARPEAHLLPGSERTEGRSMTRRYLRPPWVQRQIANRLVPRFRKDIVSILSVPGRKTGRWRTVPVAVLGHEGERYLVSYRGMSDWALNLYAAKHGRLQTKDGTEEIAVAEVPVEERPPLLGAYAREFGQMPTVTSVLRALPDPADHPIFRITTPAEAGASGGMSHPYAKERRP